MTVAKPAMDLVISLCKRDPVPCIELLKSMRPMANEYFRIGEFDEHLVIINELILIAPKTIYSERRLAELIAISNTGVVDTSGVYELRDTLDSYVRLHLLKLSVLEDIISTPFHSDRLNRLQKSIGAGNQGGPSLRNSSVSPLVMPAYLLYSDVKKWMDIAQEDGLQH